MKPFFNTSKASMEAFSPVLPKLLYGQLYFYKSQEGKTVQSETKFYFELKG